MCAVDAPRDRVRLVAFDEQHAVVGAHRHVGLIDRPAEIGRHVFAMSRHAAREPF
jgi:hypothetical protein